MNFHAKLRTNSAIHRDWIGAARVGGMISGVRFKRVGQDFVSVEDPLPGDAVSAMLHHHMIEVEVSTVPAGSVEVVEHDESDEGEGQPDGVDDTPAEDPDDPMASLWRTKAEPKQEPVMRRRGRPPLNR